MDSMRGSLGPTDSAGDGDASRRAASPASSGGRRAGLGGVDGVRCGKGTVGRCRAGRAAAAARPRSLRLTPPRSPFASLFLFHRLKQLVDTAASVPVWLASSTAAGAGAVLRGAGGAARAAARSAGAPARGGYGSLSEEEDKRWRGVGGGVGGGGPAFARPPRLPALAPPDAAADDHPPTPAPRSGGASPAPGVRATPAAAADEDDDLANPFASASRRRRQPPPPSAAPAPVLVSGTTASATASVASLASRLSAGSLGSGGPAPRRPPPPPPQAAAGDDPAWESIFEPRPAATAPAAGPAASAHASSALGGAGAACAPRARAEVRRELARLDAVTAGDLLAALEAGAAVKKKWAVKGGETPPADAPLTPAPPSRRTVRHVRVRVEGGRLLLRYYRRGAARALRRGELVAAVARVSAPAPPWAPGATFLVATDRGTLALEPPDAAAAAAWSLGLNAGLAAAAALRPAAVRACRAAAVPRAAAYEVVGE
jgi:hypothetical protein